MMYVGKDFSPMEQDELKSLGLNFVNDLEQDETLQSAVWTCEVVRGTDANPASHMLGPPRLVTPAGSIVQTATVQGFGGFLPGVVYKLRALATTSQGDTIGLHSHLYGGPADDI